MKYRNNLSVNFHAVIDHNKKSGKCTVNFVRMHVRHQAKMTEKRC